MTRPRKKSRLKRDSNPGSSALKADALTTRPVRRYIHIYIWETEQYHSMNNANTWQLLHNNTKRKATQHKLHITCTTEKQERHHRLWPEYNWSDFQYPERKYFTLQPIYAPEFKKLHKLKSLAVTKQFQQNFAFLTHAQTCTDYQCSASFQTFPAIFSSVLRSNLQAVKKKVCNNFHCKLIFEAD